ncbi:hypothetical protein HMPREF9542_05091, partial [Escherichia coli MS 117-3]
MLCGATRFIPAGAGNSLLYHDRALIPPVYPRWRGELVPDRNGDMRCLGLSPLARGTPKNAAFFAFYRRFIPAGAGNS